MVSPPLSRMSQMSTNSKEQTNEDNESFPHRPNVSTGSRRIFQRGRRSGGQEGIRQERPDEHGFHWMVPHPAEGEDGIREEAQSEGTENRLRSRGEDSGDSREGDEAGREEIRNRQGRREETQHSPR